MILGVEPRALGTLGKHSITELHMSQFNKYKHLLKIEYKSFLNLFG